MLSLNLHYVHGNERDAGQFRDVALIGFLPCVVTIKREKNGGAEEQHAKAPENMGLQAHV